MALTPGQLAAQQELQRRKQAGTLGAKGQARLGALKQGAQAQGPAVAGGIMKQYPTTPGAPAGQDTSYTAKEVFTGGRNLSGAGYDIAGDRLNNGALNTDFAPILTDRPGSGNLEADRARVEDAVYGRLTKDLDQNYNLRKQALEQRLAEQGIQFDPSPNSRYQQEMKALNDEFDNQRLAAHQTATQMGLQEHQGEFNMGETLRQNQLDEQLKPRQQNVSEISDISNLSTNTFATLAGLKDVDKARVLQKWIAQLQAKTALGTANISANASKYAVDHAGGGGGSSDEQTFP